MTNWRRIVPVSVPCAAARRLHISDDALCEFFADHFDHRYVPVAEWRHASGSEGYAFHCASGQITPATQRKLEAPPSMAVYRQMLEAFASRRGMPATA